MDAQQQPGPVFWSSNALAQMSSPEAPPQQMNAPQMATGALDVTMPLTALPPTALPSTAMPPAVVPTAVLPPTRTMMPNLAATSPPPMSIPPLPSATQAVIAEPAARLISLDAGQFGYEPYPIIALEQMIDRRVCDEMLSQWPPQHFFRYRRELGSTYALSDESNGTNYEWYIANTPLWRDFHAHVTSPAFVQYVLDTLSGGQIVTGYRAEQLMPRLEFSMIAAEGGHVMPHTDPPQRVVTIEIYMVGQGEWDPAWGGGTAMLKPTDIKQNYNFMNEPARFEQMTCLQTFPYLSGHGVMLVKTFNSHRAIYPMTGPARTLRRCLTITLDDPNLSRPL
jgi:hypothetical protein